MSIADWLMIFAVLTGPIIAVQLTRYLDNKKDENERKVIIFKTLMATRVYNGSWSHIEALNRIDLEFDNNDKQEKAVIEAWKEYNDLLHSNLMNSEQWDSKRVDLFVELLHKMAKVLGYNFDKTHIKNSSYAPRVHAATENENTALRRGLLEVLEGEREIPISFSNIQSSEK